MRAGRHIVRFDDVELSLTNSSFQLLAELARARLATRTGLTPPPRDYDEKNLLHQNVRRLRKALDEALGPRAGRDLILHGAGSRYSLALDPSTIAIDESLREVAPYHLPKGLVDDLLLLRSRSDRGS